MLFTESKIFERLQSNGLSNSATTHTFSSFYSPFFSSLGCPKCLSSGLETDTWGIYKVEKGILEILICRQNMALLYAKGCTNSRASENSTYSAVEMGLTDGSGGGRVRNFWGINKQEVGVG